MTFKNPKSWGVAIGAGVFASIAMLPQAKGDLVFESDLQQQQPANAQVAARVDDRAAMRQALGASEKAQATLQASAATAPVAAQAPTPVAAPQQVVVSTAVPVAAPVAVAPAPAATVAADTDVQNLSKAELMRRERMREEMKNEDILQERLEELRLRDERKRTDQLLTVDASASATQAPIPAPAMQTEAVVAPVTDHPGQPATAPVVTGAAAAAPVNAMAAQAAAPAMQQDQLATSRASATAVLDEPSERTLISITPRAGLANMSGGQSYDIKPHYSAGIGAALSVSDNVSFEVGYEYSEYGVALNSTNPFVINYQAYAAAGGYTGSFESVAMKQNVIDAGLKLHFLGPDAKIRPYVGGGAAYARSFVNYDSTILSAMNQSGYGYLGQDYDLTSYLGYLSTGLDVRVNKNISIGAQFKYYAVLTSRQNTNLNNLALYGYYPSALGAYPYGVSPYGTYASMSDTDKQLVGGSLAQSGFYLITGGVTFTF